MPCILSHCREGKGILQRRAVHALGWLSCVKQKRISHPTSSSLAQPQTPAVVQMDRWPQVHLCVSVHEHTPMYIYIFIYLYKHYICIHTIYVIYDICIMHINSNKCICVIFKIEQLYLEEVVNAENWLYCWSVDLMFFRWKDVLSV